MTKAVASIRHPKKREFLGAFAVTGTIAGACRTTGIDRQTVHNWKRKDPAFVEAFEEAKEVAIEHLENVARERAVAGSDVLLIFLLKAARPEVYRDRYEVTGRNNGPIEFEFVLRPPQVEDAIESYALPDGDQTPQG